MKDMASRCSGILESAYFMVEDIMYDMGKKYPNGVPDKDIDIWYTIKGISDSLLDMASDLDEERDRIYE